MLEANKEFITNTLTFWDNLTSLQQEIILKNTSFTIYKKGENIHGGKSDCTGILLVKSGELRTYILSEDGKEITLFRFYKGDICVLSASCMLANITFDVFIDAEKDSEILLINADVFQDICNKNIYAENFSYKKTAGRFSDVMLAMQQILFMSFDKRLASFLLNELSKTDNDLISLTHEQIAKYIGSAREVVSRTLKEFEKEGLIELYRGKVKVINKMRLYHLLK